MKRVLLDTSILVSAIAFKGLPEEVLIKSVEESNIEAFISQTVLDELDDVFHRNKLKDRLNTYLTFKNNFPEQLHILEDSPLKAFDEDLLPESNDRIIYRTAVANGLDILVSGDKHFLDSGVSGTRILSAREFIELIENDKEE